MEELDNWPFDQARNVACVTQKQVVNDDLPILYVIHDVEDQDWMFLTGGEFESEDALIVSMAQIVELDPTLLQIASMPPGYSATRAQIGGDWEVANDTD